MLFRFSCFDALKNPKSLLGLSIFLITCLIIFSHLWKVVTARLGVLHFDSEQLLWYIAFNEWVLVALPDTHESIEEDLRSGHLAYLLPRPISYLGATFAQAAGTLCVHLLVLGVVCFGFTWLFVGAPPLPPLGILLTLLFGLLAGLMTLLFLMGIGLAAFWLHEVSPLYWIWEKLLFMFGGLMMPLTLYPQWLQTVASFSPFPLILGTRSALALEFTIPKVLSLTLLLVTWSGLGLLALLLLYRRALKILNVEGG